MAGAGYKLFNTGDVLTAAQVNTYLQEQAVMRFASAAARTTALSGVLAEGMVSYLDDVNQVQVYNGSAWVAVGGSSPLTTKGDLYTYSTADARLGVGTNNQTLLADSAAATGLKWAPSPTSVLTATGDVLYASAANTLARLGLGTAGQVLTVNAGATAPEWAAVSAGGFTVIQDQQASSSSAINFSSISGSYKHLLLTWEGLRSTTDSSTAYDVRFNSDSSSVYHSRGISYIGTTGTVQAASNTSAGFGKLIGQGFQGAGVNDQSRGYLWIYDYASTTRFKVCVGSSSYMDQGLGETNLPMVLTNYASTSAITSVNITRIAGTGNLTNATSTSIRLYGVS